ncbi:DUF4493 domain-containing protein [Flammeovirga pectinis]|uniref:DUF4493 domain-containing protein n=1 Tax=Flammeovirga pectinis TaxID=2494373 RepID=A0A3S9P681_9BACT|nr:DUF4493 domain-containing protein [Flammeovirga pectinis]AZQ63711.1 DUF4493 domain-containing protein [Flammeovirga pectinis]
MRKFLHLKVLLLMLLSISCSKKDEVLRKGTVSLSLNANSNVTVVHFRQASSINVSSFSINIFDNNDKLVKEFPSYKDFPDQFYLNQGTYKLVAQSSPVTTAAFSSPYYYGTTDFKVTDLKSTKIDLTCVIANIKASVKYTSDFIDIFGEVYTEIENKSGKLTFENGELKEGYFSPDPITIKLYKKATKKLLISRTFNDVKPKDFYRFTFEPSKATGGISVVVDETVIDKNVEFRIPEKWLEVNTPTVQGVGIDLAQEQEIVEGNTKQTVVKIKAEGGIKSLKVFVKSANLLNEGWPDAINFTQLSQSDIDFLLDKGISYPTVINGANEVEIDFSGFINSLEAGQGVEDIFSFGFDVEDNFYQRDATKSLNLKIIPAQFTVNLDEGDVWVAKATINVTITEGNKDFVTVFYQEKGKSVWLKSKSYTTLNNKDYTYLLTGLSSNKEYRVKAVYNKNSSSELTFKTEEERQLPNAKMEDWYYDVVAPSHWIGYAEIRKYIPNSRGQSNWSTVNEKTTEHRGSFRYNYNSLSGTYNSSDSYKGSNAAEIVTVGFGSGTTNAGGASIVKKRASGQLFIGSYSYSGGSESFNYGMPFTSRPTSFKGYYKYSPYGNDEFSVEIVIENRDNGTVTELAREQYISGSKQESYTQFSIPINYSNTTLKATHMYVVIKSSIKSLDTRVVNGKHLGSTLLVDELSLNYN